MRWMIKFGLVSAGLIIVILLAVAAVDGFQILDVGGHVAIAMVLGIVLTIGVSVALMGLIFYSHNSGYDSVAHEPWKDEPPVSSQKESGR